MTSWTGSTPFAACSARHPAATTCVACPRAGSRRTRAGRAARDGAPGRVAVLGAAQQRGLLTVSARGVSVRHELTRRAIAGSLPLARLGALNQRAPARLGARGGADG